MQSNYNFMIGFEEEFEVTLRMSEQDFSAYLLSIVDSDLDELSAAFANTKNPSVVTLNSIDLN